MTNDEQQQIAAAFTAYEQQIANLAREVANKAMLASALDAKLKEAQEKIKALEKPSIKAVN
jgi:peptidoglycan hydrolase CwlO-like protein